jgi:TadE-like protein
MRCTSSRLRISSTSGLSQPASQLIQSMDGDPSVLGYPDRDEEALRLPPGSRRQSHLLWQTLSRRQSHLRRRLGSRLQSGQATVEFALVLVALVAVVWALLSLCLVVRDQVLVTHATREAARTYAVTRSIDQATQAARDRSGLGDGLVVTVERQADSLARLTVSLSIASRIPLVGRVRPGLQLQSSLITYVEPA